MPKMASKKERDYYDVTFFIATCEKVIVGRVQIDDNEKKLFPGTSSS